MSMIRNKFYENIVYDKDKLSSRTNRRHKKQDMLFVKHINNWNASITKYGGRTSYHNKEGKEEKI